MIKLNHGDEYNDSCVRTERTCNNGASILISKPA